MILSIDPGLSGALAWVSTDGHLVAIEDMPVAKIRDKNRIVAAELAALMRERQVDYVLIEQVSSRPGEGAAGAFAFGYGAGLLEGCAAAIGLPVRLVTPAAWKKGAGVPADKNGARLMAMRLWPGAVDQFKRVKDDGRAEAALMGRWAALGGVK
jgi:crossover junction endodeoxyribonuclease RuvC